LADFDGLTSYFDIPQYPWFNSILSPDPDFFKKRYGEARVNSIELHEIQVQCCRIDSLLRDADEEPNVLYLNIQGAELQALNGATRSLETFVDAVFLEINYDRRYLSCPLYDEIDAFLSGYGFIPSYIHRYPWAHFGHGEALFVRPRKIRRAHHGTNEPGEPPHVTP
jgi:hypothetical protein